MRMYSVQSQCAVSQDVGLRDETLKVHRRPANRAVSINPDLFKERSFEMVEMDEIAKVGKTARVIEEVSLGKDVAERVETIKETLRRQDVQVEEIPAARPLKDYDSDQVRLGASARSALEIVIRRDTLNKLASGSRRRSAASRT